MNVPRVRVIVWLIVILCCVQGCTAQLAPRYDAQLHEQLLKNTTATLHLFAITSSGVSRDSYPQREAYYAQVIAQTEAMMLRLSARPIAENQLLQQVDALLAKKGIPALQTDIAPSAEALKQVVLQLEKMQSVDRDRGLTPILVSTFKNAVLISLDQALTYEAFLNR